MVTFEGMTIDEDSVHFALLYQNNSDELKKLARLLTNEKLPTRKADLVAALLPFFQGDALTALWNRLDRLQQAAVTEAVHGGDGLLDMQLFQAKYNAEPSQGLLCLIFLSNGRIPGDLQDRLLKFVPKPPAATFVQIDAVPESIPQKHYAYDAAHKPHEQIVQIPVERRDMEQSAQRDLMAVLRLTDAGKISVSDTTRWPSASGIKVVSEVLDGDDF